MRILIVDDDQLFADQLKINLTNKFSLSLVDTAYSFEKALNLIACTPYDLILQDYNLDCSNGLEILKYVSNLKNPPKVILMTSYATKELVIEAINLGIYKFIEKPFRMKKLMEIMPLKKDLSKSFPLMISPLGHKAIEYGLEINLTEIEYKILAFFLQNPNKLITKDELHHHIYLSDIKAKNAINTHMTNLKNKISTFNRCLINYRGQGHVFKT